MANVTIGSTDIAIARDGVEHEYEEYGGTSERMESGALRNSRKGFKSVWQLRTPIITSATKTTYEAAIDTAGAQTCSGDALGGSASCISRKVRADRTTIKGVVKYVLHFELRQV